MNDPCGKTTKRGTACTRPRNYWQEGHDFKRADGCWHHMSQPFRDAHEARKQADEEAWLAYLGADPICWGWPIPDLRTIAGVSEEKAADLLSLWQDGRCAICGHRRESIEDHDHTTGLVRGYLCQSCNVKEGIYRDPDCLFGKYRERHPAKMLGLEICYWDPFTKEFAVPTPERTAEDPWVDAASEDIL